MRAFIPHPLPPKPPLELGAPVHDRLDAALLALGRLDGVSGLLPDVQLFLYSYVYSYVRKEAVLSSQIDAGAGRIRSHSPEVLLPVADRMEYVRLEAGTPTA